MNIKKTAITLAAAGALLASAMPAFAYYPMYPMGGDVDVTKVKATQVVSSNTGGNEIENEANMFSTVWAGTSEIKTGSSLAGGEQYVVTDLNVGCNTCGFSYYPTSTKDITKVKATQVVKSNTGGNEIENEASFGSTVGGFWSGSKITSGLSQAGATQWVVTDVNLNGFMPMWH